jgi:4-hydroxy-tetrahydrodipicolinate synthase
MSHSHSSSAGKLKGIFTPNMVPLDSRGQIDEAEFRRYIDWLIDKGVHGLYPNGSTGEFTRFTVEERQRIIKIACDQANGRVPILAGAAEANTKETIKACELYHDYGATAVAIVSPFYYKLSPDGVYAYFAEIARHSPIDVTLYNIPMFASPIDVPTMRRLAEEFDRIVGIKDSSGDVGFMGRMINAVRPVRPEFVFLTGWDVVLVPMMLMGADGGTNATSGVVPELMCKLYELASQKQWDKAIPLQLRLIELFDAMIGAEFPEGFRAAAQLRGFDFGTGRQPLSDRQHVDIENLSRLLQCIMSDFGVVDAPSEGCVLRPLGGASLYPDVSLALDLDDDRCGCTHDDDVARTVRQVTEAVLAKLGRR